MAQRSARRETQPRRTLASRDAGDPSWCRPRGASGALRAGGSVAPTRRAVRHHGSLRQGLGHSPSSCSAKRQFVAQVRVPSMRAGGLSSARMAPSNSTTPARRRSFGDWVDGTTTRQHCATTLDGSPGLARAGQGWPELGKGAKAVPTNVVLHERVRPPCAIVAVLRPRRVRPISRHTGNERWQTTALAPKTRYPVLAFLISSHQCTSGPRRAQGRCQFG